MSVFITADSRVKQMHNDSSYKLKRERVQSIWLATIVLLLAAIVRIIGLDYGRPDMQFYPHDRERDFLPLETPIHPDEYFYVSIPIQMLAQGRFNPDFYENPSFLINLNWLTYLITGSNPHGNEDIRGENQRQFAPFPFYMVGRVYSMLGGMLAVTGTFACVRGIGAQLGLRGRQVRFSALCAAALVALSTPMVQHSHYATTSSLASGFAVLAIWLSFAAISLNAHRNRFHSWHYLAGAAVMAGLSAGCRYNSAAVWIVVFAAAVLWGRQTRQWVRTLAALSLAPIAFILSTPGAVFAFDQFWQGFSYIFLAFTTGGQVPYGTPIGLWYEYRYLALFGIGLVGLGLAGFGSIFGVLHSKLRSRTIILAIYIIAYSFVVLRTVRPGHSDQLLVPIIPAFAVLTGIGVLALMKATERRYLSVWRSRAIEAIVIVALLAQPLITTLELLPLFTRTDTRLVAAAWIHRQLPSGSRIHLIGGYNVPLDTSRYEVTQTYDNGYTDLQILRDSGIDYVIYSDAIANDQQRSEAIIPPEYLEQDQAITQWLSELGLLFSIERPSLLGTSVMMHTATVWHQPSIRVYCLNADPCIADGG